MSTDQPARSGDDDRGGLGRHPGRSWCTPQSCAFRDYTVFPPDRNAAEVLAWLRRRSGG